MIAQLVRVRVKQLLAGDFVVGNVLLTLGRDQVVDELLAERFPYGRVLRRVTSMTPYRLNSRLSPSTSICRSALFPKWTQVARSEST